MRLPHQASPVDHRVAPEMTRRRRRSLRTALPRRPSVPLAHPFLVTPGSPRRRVRSHPFLVTPGSPRRRVRSRSPLPCYRAAGLAGLCPQEERSLLLTHSVPVLTHSVPVLTHSVPVPLGEWAAVSGSAYLVFFRCSALSALQKTSGSHWHTPGRLSPSSICHLQVFLELADPFVCLSPARAAEVLPFI